VDGTDPKPYILAGFDIGSVEPSGSATSVLEII
jgi:hypothetical protein